MGIKSPIWEADTSRFRLGSGLGNSSNTSGSGNFSNTGGGSCEDGAGKWARPEDAAYRSPRFLEQAEVLSTGSFHQVPGVHQ